MQKQEDLNIGTLVNDASDASIGRAKLKRLLILVRRTEGFKPVSRDTELVHEVTFRKGADLKPDGLVTGDQAIDTRDWRCGLLHGQYGSQAGSVAGLDYQNNEEPYDDHEATEGASGVLSCKNKSTITSA